MAHPIILTCFNKGQAVEPGAISIPDLWHIAQELKATGATIVVDFTDDGKPATYAERFAQMQLQLSGLLPEAE
jgi:hypothetical protein